MAIIITTKKEETNFQMFVDELTNISKKYNCAISSCGGVRIFDENVDIQDIVYTRDSSSGDIDYYFEK